MIKAVIFDFGQTLVDSADGFRKAEKEAQDRLFRDLSLTLKDKCLDNYRRIRKQFHDRLNFSRKSIWLKHHLVKRTWPDVETETPIISSLDELLQLEKLFPH